MKAKYINPFLAASMNLFKEHLGMDGAQPQPFVRKDPTALEEVSGIIGLAGETTGAVVLSFSRATAMNIVSVFTGRTYTALTNEVLDGVGEMVNIIAGNAKKDLARIPYLDIPARGHRRSVHEDPLAGGHSRDHDPIRFQPGQPERERVSQGGRGMRRRSLSIQLKIVSTIVVILVASTAASVVFTVRSQRTNLLQATERTLSVNTDLLLATIQNLMLSGEAPIAVRAMNSYQSIEGFQEISLYRANGDAAFSDYATIDDVNSFQKKIHFERTPRAAKDTEDDPNLSRAVTGRTLVSAVSTREQSIEYFFPIINLTDCRQCHGRSGFVRGVLHLKLSLASVFDQIRSARDTLTLLLGSLGLAIAALLVLLINRLIVAPVLAIGGAVRLVGQGNLDARVTVRSHDELGTLGESLNDMIAGLRERNELAIRNRVIDTRNRKTGNTSTRSRKA